MIKHLYKQVFRKRRRFFIPGCVLFLSFFGLIIIAGYIYPDILSALSLKLPVPIKNRVELVLDWKTSNRDLEKTMLAELEKEIVKLRGVLAADIVLNDFGSYRQRHSYDQTFSNTYLVTCGENFPDVFDLKLKVGKWFNADEVFLDKPPVVITQNHADFLGIKNITPKSVLTTLRGKNNKDSIMYQIVGIVSNFENLSEHRLRSTTNGNVFPIFTPALLFDKFNLGSKRLIIKMEEGYDFGFLNTQILNLIDKMNLDEYIVQHRLTSFEDVLQAQKEEHFKSFKMFYGFLLILVIYIFVALFGTFWKLTHKRTVEIGVRRAIGHSRLSVIIYVIAEPLILLSIALLPATIIFLNLYKLIKIEYPMPVYFFSTGILLLIVILATLVPVIYAGRIHPVQALADE
jgi:ABC-type antimicrobial peptide transport system permease subunit